MQQLQQIQFSFQLQFCNFSSNCCYCKHRNITQCIIRTKNIRRHYKVIPKALISSMSDPAFPRISNPCSPYSLLESGKHIRHIISSSLHLKSAWKWSATFIQNYTNFLWILIGIFFHNFEVIWCHIPPNKSQGVSFTSLLLPGITWTNFWALNITSK